MGRNNNWAYSFDGKYYIGPYETKHLAIEAAREEKEKSFLKDCREVYGDTVFIANCSEPEFPGIDIWLFLDHLNDKMVATCGEVAEGWLMDVSQDDINNLGQLLEQATVTWMKMGGYSPKFLYTWNEEKVPLIDNY